MPPMHTVDLNAGTVDTDAGPYLRAIGLSQRQIDELGRLYADR